MQKIISSIILISFILNFATTPVFAAEKHDKKTLIKTSISKNIKKETKRKEYIAPVYEDELAEELKNAGISTQRIRKYKTAIISDEEVVMSDENKNFKRPVFTGNIKTENGTEVVLKPINKIRTKTNYEKFKDHNNKTTKVRIPQPAIGEHIAFRVVKDVVKDGEIIISKNTIVYAKIAEVSPRAMGGAPAEMTIEGFEIMNDNGELIPLDGQISSSGYSLSFWIGLAELATTPFLFGLAVPLLRVLPGGQAVITPRKNYIVYY